MPIDFICPNSFSNQGGVYRLSFDNGEYYIGSSINFKMRIGAMKTEMRDGYAHNKRMKRAVEQCSTVTFEVVEFVNDNNSVKLREDYYIKQVFGDPLLINRSNTAFSNKWTDEEKEKVRKATKGICYRWKNNKSKIN